MKHGFTCGAGKQGPWRLNCLFEDDDEENGMTLMGWVITDELIHNEQEQRGASTGRGGMDESPIHMNFIKIKLSVIFEVFDKQNLLEHG